MGKIEEWKNIEGYPGYKISSFGRVKSNDRILKGSSYKGYVKVVLHNGNLKRAFYVHRLVAKYFIDNPENKPCVNHSVSERGFSPSTVCQCCKLPPQSKIHKGYYFQYAYDPETSTPDKKTATKRRVWC